MSTSYQATIDYLYSLRHFGIKLGLENISRLLEHWGQPQRQFASVLIGGTNGKGSAAAFLSSILSRAGYQTGLYTSPHLVDFRERIQIRGEYIPPQEVVPLTEELQKILATHSWCDHHPTYFEVTTALAFKYFAEQGVDIAVVEVGLGGRFDATNILSPALSLITNVDYDHSEHLGASLSAIAAEKAEIVKPGGILITAEEKEEVLAVFRRLCQERGAQMVRLQEEVKIKRPRTRYGRQVFDLEGKHGVIKDLEITLLGEHQRLNATLALLAAIRLRKLGWSKIGGVAIHEGLKKARWPGRLEILQERPALVLDGAHNLAAALALVKALPQLGYFNKLILVFGVMQDKDYKNMLATLAPLAAEVILTKPQMERSQDPKVLATYAQSAIQIPSHQGRGINASAAIQITESVAGACDLALKRAQPEDLILVTGSLFTVGEAKGWWEKKIGEREKQ